MEQMKELMKYDIDTYVRVPKNGRTTFSFKGYKLDKSLFVGVESYFLGFDGVEDVTLSEDDVTIKFNINKGE